MQTCCVGAATLRHRPRSHGGYVQDQRAAVQGEMSVAGLFASETRRAREKAGLTRDQLAEAVAFSVSLIEKVESGNKQPREQFAYAVDTVLKTHGLLSR